MVLAFCGLFLILFVIPAFIPATQEMKIGYVVSSRDVYFWSLEPFSVPSCQRTSDVHELYLKCRSYDFCYKQYLKGSRA